VEQAAQSSGCYRDLVFTGREDFDDVRPELGRSRNWG